MDWQETWCKDVVWVREHPLDDDADLDQEVDPGFLFTLPNIARFLRE